ncbi:MAG: nuclear transport factor 2 family protein, partial [Pedobacter sp.]
MKDQEKIAIAQEYFSKADQGSLEILDLFHQDIELYFPKFGFGFGKESFLEMIKGFGGSLESILHDYENLHFMPSGDFLIVEGTSKGVLNGKSREGGKTPGGRFCNVFRFRDNLIIGVHVYLDPDYTGEDEQRFR